MIFLKKIKVLILLVSFTAISTSFANVKDKRGIDLPPEKLIMLNYKSRIDNTHQPLLLKTPVDYTAEKLWPLLVVLHGFGDGPIVAPEINTMIQIGPFGRGDKWYKGIGEKDVLESIEFIKKTLPIDEDRIYLAGFSMGGYGTFRLASRFPDIWAACVPVCPRVPPDFRMKNCANVPFWIHTGKEDHVLPAKPCVDLYKKSQQIGVKKWLYTEHKEMGHSFNINWKDVEKWLIKHKKKSFPEEIDFVSDSLDFGSIYWIEVKKVIEPGKPIVIEGKIKSETVDVIIDNISSLKIDFSGFEDEEEIEIKEVIIRDGGGEIYSGKLLNNSTFIYNKEQN